MAKTTRWFPQSFSVGVDPAKPDVRFRYSPPEEGDDDPKGDSDMKLSQKELVDEND